MQNENGTPAVQGQSVRPTVIQNGNSAVNGSIPQQDGNIQGKVMGSRKTRMLTMASKVNACAIKCYEEQLPWGLETTVNAIRNSVKSYVQIIAIQHYRDTLTDGIWEPSTEKAHLHVIVRFVDRKKRMRVKNILESLGIEFREGVDDELWRNRAVETIGDFSAYATYLTHDTEDAIREGKEPYSLEELYSNLTIEEIQRVRDGYVRLSDKVHKVTPQDLIKLDRDAFTLGTELKNFDSWYDAQPFFVRSHGKFKTIKESYDRGVATRVQQNSAINRLCIFIQGPPNTGKTYAARQALLQLGQDVLDVGGGGSGKFDSLRPDHGAVLIDDDVCPNLLNVTDNYICKVYRRNRNNPVWAGQYFVVTSNMDFEQWLSSCGIIVRDHNRQPSRHLDAMVSRFFICRTVMDNRSGRSRLSVTSASDRGLAEIQQERLNMFQRFLFHFNAVIGTYVPQARFVNYSEILEPTAIEFNDLQPYLDLYRPRFYAAFQSTGFRTPFSDCMPDKCPRCLLAMFCPCIPREALDNAMWNAQNCPKNNADCVAAVRRYIEDATSTA